MSQIATVILSGYVAMEPKLVFTKQTDTPVVHLRIGTTPRRVDRDTGEWRSGVSSFFTVNCWRKLALNVHASLKKGDPVLIRGRLKTWTWQEDGKNRTVVEIDADSIGHDLTFGWSHYLKGVNPKLLPLLDRQANIGPNAQAGSPPAGDPFSLSGGLPSPGEPPAEDEDDEEPGDVMVDGQVVNPFMRPADVEPGTAEPVGEMASEAVPF